jgi:hypothetical protein
VALLLEHETTLRRRKRFEARARAARLRQSASIEDVDYRAARGLDRALFRKLAACEWIRTNALLLFGPRIPQGLGEAGDRSSSKGVAVLPEQKSSETISR